MRGYVGPPQYSCRLVGEQEDVSQVLIPGSKGSSKFIPVDEESNHEIVHVLRLGEAQRAADEALDPGPQIDMFALDLLRVLLAHLMLLGREISLVGPPAVGVKLRDTKRRQQLLELQEDVVLVPAEYICQDFPRVMMLGKVTAQCLTVRFRDLPV